MILRIYRSLIVLDTLIRICSISVRLREPGNLNMLRMNVWQSVTEGPFTMSRNISASATISSDAKIASR